MNLRILNETTTTVTIGWDQIPAAGFRFYIDGIPRSVTMDGTRHSARFGKPDAKLHTYGVRALQYGEGGSIVVPFAGVDNSLAQSWLILGQDPQLALYSPSYYKLAVTADPAYRGFITSSFLQAARAQGRTIYSWCDSRSDGTGTPPSVAKQVMADYGLDGWMGEGESAAAFDNVLAAGGKVAVVNLSALRPDQLQAIKERRCLVTVELYRNCNGNQQPDWKNVNEGVGGNCIAVYRDGQCGGMSLARYIADGMFAAHRDSVYGPQMTADDYRALP